MLLVQYYEVLVCFCICLSSSGLYIPCQLDLFNLEELSFLITRSTHYTLIVSVC